jgi:nitrile hydratase
MADGRDDGGDGPEHEGGHGHDHDHGEHGSALSDVELRVRAMETVLTEKGYVDPATLDRLIETYETRVGPHVGAAVVARAWVDPAFRAALFADAPEAITGAGFTAYTGNLIAVENTPTRHNVVVCTLCSCYPWALLGLPPNWYKSFAYRARAVKEPRGVLAEFGVTLPEATEIHVWDATVDMRYLVVPMRPGGTEGWDERRLATLVTRNSMVGTDVAALPGVAP